MSILKVNRCNLEHVKSDKTMLSLTPNLQNKEISIRPLVQTDFDGLFACGGNKEVWAGHPNSDRYKRKNFEKWFLDAINSGSGLTVIDNKTEKIIGSTRFYFEATSNDAIAIGFTFLACEYWGGETNYPQAWRRVCSR